MVNNPPQDTQRLMPRLAYSDPAAAIEFLCSAFGFVETARFAPAGQIIHSELAMNGETLFAVGSAHEDAKSPKSLGGSTVELFCYVDDVDGHCDHATKAGAQIVSLPEQKFWGDLSYDVLDIEGYLWSFRRNTKDVILPDSKPSVGK